jgi:multiple sugar transport system ATP-binding protein
MPERRMTRVRFDHVTKRFGQITAVEDLSLNIADKEFVVIVGPSGCGKSTILRLVAGLETVDEGDIWIGDRIVNDVPPAERKIAMVFETESLYPHLTVDQNLSFGLKLRQTPADEILERVKRAASSMALPGILNRKSEELSAGQRQQAAIGRAIVHKPDVFLMDEPLSKLDPKLQESARAEISRLQRRLDTTFIYVTHDQVQAMTLGDRIAVLNEGLLQQVAAPMALYRRPINVFVAGFIGSPSMNFFDAHLVSEGGQQLLDLGDIRLIVPAERTGGYESYIDKKVIFGIRPEHIHAREYAPPDIAGAPIQVVVEMVEMTGRNLQLHLSGRGLGHVSGSFVAIVDTRTAVTLDKQIDLVLDMSQMHLFDKKTERTV